MRLEHLDSDVAIAARELAGNWRKFTEWSWSGKPEHRPEDCAIVYTSNRDSQPIDFSNEATILAALDPFLGAIDDGDHVERQSHGHWACGHVDGIVIRCIDDRGDPTPAFRVLHALAMRLANYPVLNEGDLTEREQEAADQTWRNCYRDADRTAYIRDHADQFEFRRFADLIACVRGKYFAGYASELIS